jgi:chemotaxis protein MotB
MVFLVMILMTPFTAFAPHTIAPGPANHLNAVDVFQRYVLGIPVNASKERRVGEALAITKDDMPKLKEELEKAISKVPNFDKIKDQIEITITPEGLRIELLESETGTFFQIGNSAPSDNGKALLSLLAQELGKLPNHVSIEGHTDSKPYAGRREYGNWELSTDRANAARRLMQHD